MVTTLESDACPGAQTFEQAIQVTSARIRAPSDGFAVAAIVSGMRTAVRPVYTYVVIPCVRTRRDGGKPIAPACTPAGSVNATSGGSPASPCSGP